MSLLITDNDVVQARVVCSLQSQIGINVFHYIATSHVGTGASYQDAAAAINTAVAAAYKAAIATPATYYGVGCRKVFPAPISVEYSTTTLTGLGGGGASELPKQTAGIIRKFTETAGRHGRGRAYIPFPSPSGNGTDGKPTAGYVAALDALATILKGTVTAGGGGNTTLLTPILFQRAAGPSTLISNMRGQLVWGTQRRRGDYGKTNLLPF